MITRSKRRKNEEDSCATACHQTITTDTEDTETSPSPLVVSAATQAAATISADESDGLRNYLHEYKDKGKAIEEDLLCNDDDESDSENEYCGFSKNYDHYLMKYHDELILARGEILARRLRELADDDDDDDVEMDDDDDESCMCRHCQYDTGTSKYDFMDEDDSSNDEDEEYTSKFKNRVIKSLDTESDTDDYEKKNCANSWSATKKKLTF